MKFWQSTFIALALATAPLAGQVHAEEKTYVFEAGQVIDFLFLTRRPNSDEAYRSYAQDAISEARALDYKGLSGFAITRKPTQGNYYPELLIFGGWPGDFEDRANALDRLKEVVPDLNDRRLDIWSRFDMTNYQISQEIRFDVDYEKVQVLTAYWQKDPSLFKAFKTSFVEEILATGGELKAEFTEGRSPFGYEYNPDYTVIAEWDTQAAFDLFLAKNLQMDHAGVTHVNQMYLTPIKPGS